nr:MAG: hypothetical protein DIU62_10980 [Pseudomonadota bacterium]
MGEAPPAAPAQGSGPCRAAACRRADGPQAGRSAGSAATEGQARRAPRLSRNHSAGVQVPLAILGPLIHPSITTRGTQS